MTKLQEVLTNALEDRKITADEVDAIRDVITSDGKLDLDDVKFLVELLSNSTQVCSEFDKLFFPILKEVVLADGKIGRDEQFYLLKMLYSDGVIRDVEKRFLAELRSEANEVPPEFDDMCRTAFQASATNWDLGG